MMIVGVDFDNTIVCYDDVFFRVASELSMIPGDLPPSKGHVRDYLRSIDQEDKWTELQGMVYGDHILKASPFPGVRDFFIACRAKKIKVLIISHKTLHPFIGKQTDLHESARKWLKHNKFYDADGPGIDPSEIFFELTKEAKIGRIATEKCDFFVDDLVEFLSEPAFPKNVKKILFSSAVSPQADTELVKAASWADVGRIIL